MKTFEKCEGIVPKPGLYEGIAEGMRLGAAIRLSVYWALTRL